MKNDNDNYRLTTHSSNINDLQYSLFNADNFKSSLNYTLNNLSEKYVILLTDYLVHVSENLKTFKNNSYSDYIILKGIETFTNVFNNLLFYTKNLNVSFYNTQRAYYLYVEFIGQITEEHNSYLQLSPKDATIYVYKKTIYELHNDLKKNVTVTTSENDLLETNNIVCEIYRTICSFIIENYKSQLLSNPENIKDFILNLDKFIVFREKKYFSLVMYILENICDISKYNNYSYSFDFYKSIVEELFVFLNKTDYKKIFGEKFGENSEQKSEQKYEEKILKIKERITELKNDFERIIENHHCNYRKFIEWLLL
jgi:hypothetical protein